MLKEKIRETEEQLSQKQCKWRNVYFHKNGKSYRGFRLYDSKSEAEKAAQTVVAKCRGLIKPTTPGKTGFRFNSMDGQFLGKDYSWHMQMPILD